MKKTVNYSILKDMQQYVKGFNPEDYESTTDETDPTVIEYLRDYYASHLPVPVTVWYKVNIPNNNLIYGKGCGDQIQFVRDKINELLSNSYEYWLEHEPLVISTHVSKSVRLPVFKIELKKFDMEIIMRCNFYDWKISIDSKIPIRCDFLDLFDPAKTNSPFCYEGFPKDKIFGTYNENPAKFSVSLNNTYEVYTFFFLLKNYLGIKLNLNK